VLHGLCLFGRHKNVSSKECGIAKAENCTGTSATMVITLSKIHVSDKLIIMKHLIRMSMMAATKS
jgi:hypothetical protein